MLIVVAIGVVCGIVAAIPVMYVLGAIATRPRPFGFGVVLACCIVPFLVLQVLMLAVNYLWHAGAVQFGTASTLTFLGVVIVSVLLARPWR